MKKEVTASASTIDEAIEKAALELGVKKEDCLIEVIETPKRSLFGKNKPAVVKATYEDLEDVAASLSAKKPLKENVSRETKENKLIEKTKITNSSIAQFDGKVTPSEEKKLEIALEYSQEILDKMGLTEVKMTVSKGSEGATITFDGEGMAVLIGHHGETLDALQYLVVLTANRIDSDYYRVTLDCGNYRQKRESTLQSFATRIAEKVKATGKSQVLEPMNPYERRIIHAIVSDIAGVYSKSKGEEPQRRVVILSETPAKVNFNRNTNTAGGARRANSGGAPHATKKPYVHKPERTMEEILKNDFKEKVDSAELYSKIDI